MPPSSSEPSPGLPPSPAAPETFGASPRELPAPARGAVPEPPSPCRRPPKPALLPFFVPALAPPALRSEDSSALGSRHAGTARATQKLTRANRGLGWSWGRARTRDGSLGLRRLSQSRAPGNTADATFCSPAIYRQGPFGSVVCDSQSPIARTVQTRSRGHATLDCSHSVLSIARSCRGGQRHRDASGPARARADRLLVRVGVRGRLEWRQCVGCGFRGRLDERRRRGKRRSQRGRNRRVAIGRPGNERGGKWSGRNGRRPGRDRGKRSGSTFGWSWRWRRVRGLRERRLIAGRLIARWRTGGRREGERRLGAGRLCDGGLRRRCARPGASHVAAGERHSMGGHGG